MKFDYYYGSQADQFTFIRIPKVMITDDSFAALSIAAKMLYGVLLDRMSLSRKNGWLDGENRVFIVYPISEIQEDLGFSRKKAMEYLGELESFGLVEKRRRGLGLPSILYVKSFLASGDAGDSEVPGEDAETSMQINGTSGSVEIGTSGSSDATVEWQGESGENSREPRQKGFSVAAADRLEEGMTEIYGSNADQRAGSGAFYLVKQGDLSGYAAGESCPDQPGGSQTDTSRSSQTDTSRGVESGTSRSSQNGLQEVPDSAPLMNNTELNKTEANNIPSHLIRVTGETVPADRMGCDTMSACAQIIAENLQIEDLKRLHPLDADLLDGIYAMVLETVASTRDTIVIASNTVPMSVVKSRFLQLDAGHIEYVLTCFKSNTTKVRNIRKYLLAALYNAPTTIDGYYQAEANYDMYGT